MISKRLQKILSFIDGMVIADIGCDHAYIACYSAKEGRVKKAYACDVAQGPLNHAVKTIEQMDLENKVFPILMDGIKGLPEDTDQIVIAGMGAELTGKILDEYSKLKTSPSLVLSPHKDSGYLREYLSNNGFYIVKEEYIQEDNHFYPVIKAEKGWEKLSAEETLFGKNVSMDQDYMNFLEFEKNKWTRILEKIPEAKRGLCLEYLSLLENRIHRVIQNSKPE